MVTTNWGETSKDQERAGKFRDTVLENEGAWWDNVPRYQELMTCVSDAIHQLERDSPTLSQVGI